MRKKILLAEDNHAVLAGTTQLLRSYGHEVSEAVNGYVACQILSSGLQDFDFVMSDYRMPQMNGLELLILLMENSRSGAPRFILVSSDLPPHVRTEAISLGAHVLSKPYSEEKLLEILHPPVAGQSTR